MVRAAVTMAPGVVEIHELPAPRPGPGEALVRVEAVGICGSDLHIFRGHHPYFRYPQAQGHELGGVVVAVGPGYEGRAGVGDRVAVEPLISCGHCYPCRLGRPNCCVDLKVLGAHVPGGLSELIAVAGASLYPVGDLEPELAALVEPVSIGFWAVDRGQVSAGEHVLVFGAGPIGLTILLCATDRGAEVMVVDPLPARLRLASELGAALVTSPDQDLASRVGEWTSGEGPAIVFDATGAPAVIRSAVDLVANAGRVVVVGLSEEEVSLPVLEFTRKELTVMGSRNNGGIFAEAVGLVQRSRDRVRRLVSHRFPLERAGEAMAYVASHPGEVEKVMIVLDSR